MSHARLALAALAAEAALGWPARRHPVEGIGALIDRLDRHWNRPPFRRAKGLAALGVIAGASALAAGATVRLGRPAALAVATAGLAQRSLWTHVRAVERALAAGNLPLARLEVAKIVGRDTAELDEAGIAKAAI